MPYFIINCFPLLSRFLNSAVISILSLSVCLSIYLSIYLSKSGRKSPEEMARGVHPLASLCGMLKSMEVAFVSVLWLSACFPSWFSLPFALMAPFFIRFLSVIRQWSFSSLALQARRQCSDKWRFLNGQQEFPLVFGKLCWRKKKMLVSPWYFTGTCWSKFKIKLRNLIFR